MVVVIQSTGLRFLDTNGAWQTEDEERSIFRRFAGKVTREDE